MRKLLLSAVALGTLAAAVPAAAQWAPRDRGYGYGYGHQDYRDDYRYNSNINGRVNQIARQIDRLYQRGNLTGSEARGLRRELDYLVQLDSRARYNGYRGYERADLENRLRRLEQRVRYEARDRQYREGGRYDGRYADRDRDGVADYRDRYDYDGRRW